MKPDFFLKNWQPKIGLMRQNQASNQAFLTFSQVSFISFPSSAFNDSLQLCLTSSSGKIHGKKFLGPNSDQMGQN